MASHEAPPVMHSSRPIYRPDQIDNEVRPPATTRDVPLWLLCGLAAASALILLFRPVLGEGVLAFAGPGRMFAWATLAGSTMLAAHRVALLVAAPPQRPTFLVRQEPGSLWKQGVAADGAIHTTLSLRLRVANLRAETSEIRDVRLLDPKLKGDLVDWHIGTAVAGSCDKGDNLLGPGARANVHLTFVLRRPIGNPGRLLPMQVEIVDQRGQTDRFRFRLLAAKA